MAQPENQFNLGSWRDPSEKNCAEVSLAALLMLQVQMSTAHEGKLMKESSLQTQSSISLPSQDLHAVYGM